MFTLYVGNNDTSVAENAKKENSNAYLIDHSNWNQTHTDVAYTSLSDLPSEIELAFLFRQADVIVYIPPINNIWSDGKNSKQKVWTEHYLTVFSFVKDKQVINFNVTKDINDVTIKLEDLRKTDKKQLWCVGCSMTYGTGITNVSDRYSNILSEKTNLPMSLLAKVGSSIFWASDQILKSDIRPNDILVWGITSPNRFPYYNEEDKTLYHILYGDHKRKSKEITQLKSVITEKFLIDFNLTFLAINQILQVVKMCRSNNIRLVLAGLLPGIEMASYLANLPEYIHLEGQFGLENNKWIDLGTEKSHPGPKTHQWYADEIFKRLNT